MFIRNYYFEKLLFFWYLIYDTILYTRVEVNERSLQYTTKRDRRNTKFWNNFNNTASWWYCLAYCWCWYVLFVLCCVLLYCVFFVLHPNSNSPTKPSPKHIEGKCCVYCIVHCIVSYLLFIQSSKRKGRESRPIPTYYCLVLCIFYNFIIKYYI